MNRLYPQDDSPESLEGTAAHWVLSEMLAGVIHKENELAPNGIMVTGEMLDGAELAHDTVTARIPWATGADLHVEERVSVPSIHNDCFGTPDIWAFTLSDCHLEIVDYKFGHRFVDEFFNPQGLLYALGCLEKVKLIGDPQHVTVSFTIVQPRCFYRGMPVRTHSFTVKQAAEYIKALKTAAHAAYITPVTTTGPQCDHCPGRHVCPTLQKAAYSDAEFGNDRQPHNLTPQAAALELRMLERALGRLEARVEGLRELTLANIKAGANIPYYRAEPGRGRQQWNTTPEQIITIGQMLGKNLSQPGVVTPAQAKKLGIDEAVIMAYSAITSGSLKLIPENNADALRVFGRGD